MASSLGQLESGQGGVRHLVVHHRRHKTRLQGAGGDHVLDRGAHGVAGHPLGVGDLDLGEDRSEGVAQGHGLGFGAAAAGGGVGLVGEVQEVGREAPARNPVERLHATQELVELFGVARNVQTGVVPRGVEHVGAQQLADGGDAAFGQGVGRFDDDAHRAGAHDHAVAAQIEGQCRLVEVGFGARRPGAQEARAQVGEAGLGGRVVGGDHEEAIGAAGTDHLFGEGHGRASGGARRVDLEVGSHRADQACQTVVGQHRDLVDELVVEVVDLVASGRRRKTAAVQHEPVGQELLGVRIPHLLDQRLVELQDLGSEAAAQLVVEMARDLLDHGFHHREAVRDDHSGALLQARREDPAVGQQASRGGAGVLPHQRDARVAQSFVAGGHPVQDGLAHLRRLLRVDRVVGQGVDLADLAGQLDDFLDRVQHLEGGTVGGLLDASHAQVGEPFLLGVGQALDEVVPREEAFEIVVLEGTAERSGQPDRHAAVDHALAGRFRGGGDGAVFGRCGSRGGDGRCGRNGGWGCGLDGNRFGGWDQVQPDSFGEQRAQGLVEGFQLVGVLVVAAHHDGVAVLQDGLHEVAQHRAGADFHEQAHAAPIQFLEAAADVHGGGHLALQDRADLGVGIGIGGAGLIDQDVGVSARERQVLDRCAELAGGGSHHGRVEGVAHVEFDVLDVFRLQEGAERFDRLRRTACDDLVGGVEVRDLDGKSRSGDQPFQAGAVGAYRHHFPEVVGLHFHEGAAALVHGPQRVGQGKFARGGQGHDFAGAVADHPGRAHAHVLEQVGHREIPPQQGGVGVAGVLEDRFGGFLAARLGRDQARDAFAVLPAPPGVDAGDGPADGRKMSGQSGQHVGVLRTLAGEQEGGLRKVGAGAFVPENSLGAQKFAGGGIGGVFPERDLRGQGFDTIEDHGESAGMGRVGAVAFFERELRQARGLPAQVLQEGPRAGPDLGVVGSGQEDDSRRGGRRSDNFCRSGSRCRADVDVAGAVLLEGEVVVRAAESEGAHAGAARMLLGGPGLRLGVDVERRTFDAQIRIDLLAARRGRQDPVTEGLDGLDEARHAGRRLEVPDVRLGRTHRAESGSLGAALLEAGLERLDLADVADLGGGAVRFDQFHRVGREARHLVGALDRFRLPDRIGGGDGLALAVAALAVARDHGVDGIAVAHGVRQALEDDDAPALPDHEAVGAFVEGVRSVGTERVDPREVDASHFPDQHVGGAAHDGVAFAAGEVLHAADDRGETRGAGGVDDVRVAVEIEDRRDPRGHDVGEDPGGAVLRHGHRPRCGPGLQVAQQGLAPLGVHRLPEGGMILQVEREAFEVGLLLEGVVGLADHGAADEHRDFLAVDPLERDSRKGLVGRRQGDLLVLVHVVGDGGRDPVLAWVEGEVADQRRYVGVRLVLLVGLPEHRRIEVGLHVEDALGRRIVGDLADGDFLLEDVVPELVGRVRVGQDAPDAYDRDFFGERAGIHSTGPMLELRISEISSSRWQARSISVKGTQAEKRTQRA